MKLYKDNNGLWVVGDKIVPQGVSLLEVGDAITISIINSNSILFRGQIEELQKENGDPYADLDELLIVCKDFFSNPLNDLVADVEGLKESVVNWVGVVIDPTSSSSETAPKSTNNSYKLTELQRTGNLFHHTYGNSRIFNSFQLAIVDRETKKVAWYLDKDNPSLKADRTQSTPDWTTQNICVIIPDLYRRVRIVNEQTGRYEIAYDIEPFEGSVLWHERSAHSPGFAAMDRTTTQLVSVVTDDVRFRGGNNSSSRDNFPDTQIGRPATSISRTNFENYAAAAGWETGNIKDRTLWHELTALYFANTNIQLAFTETLTAEGYPQGGLGAGVTGWNSLRWSYKNDYYPLHKIGEGFMTIGCNVGVKDMIDDMYYIGKVTDVASNKIVATGNFANNASWRDTYIGYTVKNLQTGQEAIIVSRDGDDQITLNEDIFKEVGEWYWIKGVEMVYQIPVFFGLENLYGDLYDWVSGVNIEVSASIDNGGTGESKAYVCTDFNKRSDTITPDYVFVGNTPRRDNYIKELYTDFVIPKVNAGASSTTYMADYGYYGNHPNTGNTIRGLLFGGFAYSGSDAGVRLSYSYGVPAAATANFGARLRVKID